MKAFFRSASTTMTSIKEVKAAVRAATEKKLAEIPVEERQRQSEIVKEKLFRLSAFKDAKNVSIFLSLDTEINTEPIIRKMFEAGKKCFIPRYTKSGMEMVELYSMEDWETLPVTKWNIKQPAVKEKRPNALDSGLDLIVLPGVAFTKDGNRLGHGGGYYDKYLQNICRVQTKKPSFIAVAFKEQVLSDLPTEDTDYKVDTVLYAE